MAAAFCLRYQERCSLGDLSSILAGTETMTKTVTEGSDTDRKPYLRAVPVTRRLGSQTQTFINTEASDQDFSPYGSRAVPNRRHAPDSHQ
jgi:hypothetical protein